MRLHELPTHLVRALAERCRDYDVACGDCRVTLKAVHTACWEEIDRRIGGGDFPEISDEAVAAFAAQIKTSMPAEFARLLFDLES